MTKDEVDHTIKELMGDIPKAVPVESLNETKEETGDEAKNVI